MKKHKILFISHDAYRAGAQLLLLQLLHWITHTAKNVECRLLLSKGGELENEFKEVSIVYLWEQNFNTKNPIERIKNKRHCKDIKKNLLQENFNLIYSNTICNGHLIHEIGLKDVPVITHVHEMNYWIKKMGEKNLSFVKEHTAKFIAASNAVRNLLIKEYSLDGNNIEVIYEFTNSINSQKKNSLKKHLGLTDDAIIVGGCGAENWRKGKDLFILTAIVTLQEIQNNNIHFVWIGGGLNEELKHDVMKSGFSDQILFIDHLPNASSYFDEFAVFCMTSREDPFPLVNLEAGLRKVPIVCFEDAGGTVELIEAFQELIIPYGNIKMMSERIIELINNEERRQVIGQRLMEKIESELMIDKIAKKLMNAMYTVMEKSDVHIKNNG